MKKAILTFVLCAAMAANAFAGLTLTDINVDWSGEVTGFTGNISAGAYNYVTDHFLYCDYSAKEIRVGNNTNGALTGATLSKTGLTLVHGLGFFAVCVGSDGVIFAGSNESADGLTDYSFFRWDSETDTAPTEVTPAPFGAVGMAFPRAMDAYGTGLDTLVGVTGYDQYNMTILTTTDGTTFAVTDTTPIGFTAGDPETRMKQGCVIASPTRAYGTKADGPASACNVTALEKVGGTWQAIASFTPPGVATMSCPGPVGFIDGYNAPIFLGISPTGGNVVGTVTDPFTVLNGQFGNQILQVDSGVNVGAYGYGAIDVDGENGVAYFVARSSTAAQAVAGKLSFEPYSVPLATTGSWGLYE